MNIAQPRVDVLTYINEPDVYTFLETCGRTSYKSEGKITGDSAIPFLQKLIKNGHESVLEHYNITVRFITDRGVTHELVRHRLCSYTQESTRYVNYEEGLNAVEPPFVNPASEEKWLAAMYTSQGFYRELIDLGEKPEIARSVLPTCLKTEIVHTANIREWRHILKLRTEKHAHPQIQQIMNMLLEELKEQLPVLFGDINA